MAGATPCMVLWRPRAAVCLQRCLGAGCGKGQGGPEQFTRRGSAAGFLRYASALCWEPSDRGSVAAGCAQRGLFNFGRHVGNGHALPCVNNSAPFESPSRWLDFTQKLGEVKKTG